MKLGILGGGQLGRMLALAAQPMGIRVTVVDPNRDAVAAVAAKHICADYVDPEALRLLAQEDVVTFEFENVPDVAARQLASQRPVYPSPEALRVAQDRWLEKSTFAELGIGTPRFRRIDSLSDAQAAFAELGPLVLKTRRGGYDGKGQRVVRRVEDLSEAYAAFTGIPTIAEELVAFERELSVLVCRGVDGSTAIYPLTQNHHEGGILRLSLAPAPDLTDSLQTLAESWGQKLVEHFGYVGLLALELFQVNGTLLVNEFAPRVHNSGHWTIEGARTSQFENHVRAVCGLPLGDPSAWGPAAMINCIGAMPEISAVLAIPDTHFHDYGKEPRAGRKVGHITVRAPDAESLRERTAAIVALLPTLSDG